MKTLNENLDQMNFPKDFIYVRFDATKYRKFKDTRENLKGPYMIVHKACICIYIII